MQLGSRTSGPGALALHHKSDIEGKLLSTSAHPVIDTVRMNAYLKNDCNKYHYNVYNLHGYLRSSIQRKVD